MARVKGPLFSLDASQKLAKAIVFSKWKGRNYVRSLVRPANPKSGLQVGMRSSLRFTTQNYKFLLAANITNWKAAAKAKNITPLNAMVKAGQVRTRQNFGLQNDPTTAAGAVEAAPTGFTATAQPKSVNIVWVDSVGASDWCTYIYMSTTGAFVPDISNLIQVVARGKQQFTAAKLKTGTPYFFRACGCEKGGTLGTLAAQITATPT